MITDQVVAALVAEGYGRDRIRTLMDSLAEADWRDEDEDWSARDLTNLRRQLGTPPVATPDDHEPTEPADSPADEPDDVSAGVPASQSDIDLWAADLARVLDRTTGGKNPLDTDQIRRVAGELLHRTSSYVLDFTVTHWADDLAEAIRMSTSGQVELNRVDLEVAANLLLHAQEDDWVPQAARLRAEHQRGPDAAS